MIIVSFTLAFCRVSVSKVRPPRPFVTSLGAAGYKRPAAGPREGCDVTKSMAGRRPSARRVWAGPAAAQGGFVARLQAAPAVYNLAGFRRLRRLLLPAVGAV